jgi:hypothetical protein
MFLGGIGCMFVSPNPHPPSVTWSRNRLSSHQRRLATSCCPSFRQPPTSYKACVYGWQRQTSSFKSNNHLTPKRSRDFCFLASHERKGQLAGCSLWYRRYFCISKPSSGRRLHEAETDSRLTNGSCAMSLNSNHVVLNTMPNVFVDSPVLKQHWLLNRRMSTRTVRNRLKSARIKSRRVIKRPLLVDRHRRTRLAWCLARRGWNLL